jgi:hypothetical protein
VRQDKSHSGQLKCVGYWLEIVAIRSQSMKPDDAGIRVVTDASFKGFQHVGISFPLVG